ncbi:peptidase S9 [Candidatus Bathyarchaeota archaeon RBG_13_38_9]|nr:MAG: peptidase S9 [Candidatus Bathyarchaeota archaeon RBG_13_38_9]
MNKLIKISILIMIFAILIISSWTLYQGAKTELIPRKVLFGNPDRITVRLSPDGTKISFLAPVNDVLNVWVGPIEDPMSARPATTDTDRGIYSYFWSYTNEHIIYIQDKAGEENWRIYSANVGTNITKDLTPLEGVNARIQGVSPKFPYEILVALNDRVPELHDIYRVNIVTGYRQLIEENEGFAGYMVDDDYNIRFAYMMTADGGYELLEPNNESEWELFLKVPMEDTLTTDPIGFDKTGNFLYMIDSRDRNTAALFQLNLENKDRIMLAENETADVDDLIFHPTEKTVQAVAFYYDRKHWEVLDEDILQDLTYLKSIADGDVEIVSRTLDDKYWIVAYILDNGPVQYYFYDHIKQKAEFLFTNNQQLEDLPLAQMHPTVIESRDGLNLVSYYTLPINSHENGELRPRDPLPMVLLVHGGPWSRDIWGYESQHQWLANRGYAVLSVNFRMSTGFGKEFINAGNLEWGGKMHDDLIDAVQWAVDEGIADPDRIAIMGASYGGYATLAGMTFTPEIFACGIDIVGPSNLVTLLESLPPYWEPTIELFTKRVGDHRTDEGKQFLIERSPLTYVDRIQKPLLIGQGANDPRVKQSESDQIVQSMEEKEIPVTYVLYPDEGHGFARPENRLSFYAVVEAFLSECLGGSYEPIGEDFKGSSITVPTGAEHIPGLIEELKNLERVIGENESQEILMIKKGMRTQLH